jgi:hypothetical protein
MTTIATTPTTTPTTESMTVALRQAQRDAASALRQFPGDDNEDKERRALKAALHVHEIAHEFSSTTATRFYLEGLFRVSERQVRRAEKILRYPEIVKLVLKGPVSVTNAAQSSNMRVWTCWRSPGRAPPKMIGAPFSRR